ncbi:MAG: tetratricopeptide repeat protein [Acidimicrobiia bacterium]
MSIRNSLVILSLLLAFLGCTDRADALYRRGLDLYQKKQYDKALPFILEAAEAGHTDGMSVLGAMYLFGRGVQDDGVKAEFWLKRAARSGQVDAQSILGIMYATGQGVARNIPKAKEWLVKAAKAGDQHAIDMLRRLGGGSSISL